MQTMTTAELADRIGDTEIDLDFYAYLITTYGWDLTHLAVIKLEGLDFTEDIDRRYLYTRGR